MECKIDKKDAKWLYGALSRNPAVLQYHYAEIIDFGGARTIGATDCYRLHAMEVDASIPQGLYNIDPKTGVLTPVTLNCQKGMDWSFIVPKGIGTKAAVETMQDGYYILDSGHHLNAKHVHGITANGDRPFSIEMVGKTAIIRIDDTTKFGVTLAVKGGKA